MCCLLENESCGAIGGIGVSGTEQISKMRLIDIIKCDMCEK